MYGSTTKDGGVKMSDCILVYGSTTKGGVVERSDCILVYGSTTKGGVVKRSDCILVNWSTTKGGGVQRSDCTTRLESCLLLDVNHYYWCSLVIFQSKQIHRPKYTCSVTHPVWLVVQYHQVAVAHVES